MALQYRNCEPLIAWLFASVRCCGNSTWNMCQLKNEDNAYSRSLPTKMCCALGGPDRRINWLCWCTHASSIVSLPCPQSANPLGPVNGDWLRRSAGEIGESWIIAEFMFGTGSGSCMLCAILHRSGYIALWKFSASYAALTNFCAPAGAGLYIPHYWAVSLIWYKLC